MYQRQQWPSALTKALTATQHSPLLKLLWELLQEWRYWRRTYIRRIVVHRWLAGRQTLLTHRGVILLALLVCFASYFSVSPIDKAQLHCLWSQNEWDEPQNHWSGDLAKMPAEGASFTADGLYRSSVFSCFSFFTTARWLSMLWNPDAGQAPLTNKHSFSENVIYEASMTEKGKHADTGRKR